MMKTSFPTLEGLRGQHYGKLFRKDGYLSLSQRQADSSTRFYKNPEMKSKLFFKLCESKTVNDSSIERAVRCLCPAILGVGTVSFRKEVLLIWKKNNSQSGPTRLIMRRAFCHPSKTNFCFLSLQFFWVIAVMVWGGGGYQGSPMELLLDVSKTPKPCLSL